MIKIVAEKELRRLGELELLQSKKDGARPAKKRRRKQKKVEFDEDVVEAAEERQGAGARAARLG